MMLQIRPLEPCDREWVAHFVAEQWGSTRLVSRGKVHFAEVLPGFVAWLDGARTGLATFCIAGNECELVSLNTMKEQVGVGTTLVEAVSHVARTSGCRRLWLITTNDNLNALRFYQKRGFRLVAVYPNALEQSRRLKPELPLFGSEGIPLRDEIELELPMA